ncbi:hypothetical protein J5N58_25775 [Rhizobium cremeum]|uniref:hypothetical protein n=1 Tax=Rhizobium cremeum TaxID=2813827 RepID=UPI0013B00408|nr:hypothetical protein [Rhizobium cremeum]MCJ7997992.1 hypothetical protein [Rhizobium cremeum]MCJ8003095.1 hypothetical protein [Rhizobium cremeum]
MSKKPQGKRIKTVFSTRKGPQAHNEAASNAAFLLSRHHDEKNRQTNPFDKLRKPSRLAHTNRPKSASSIGDAGWSSPFGRQSIHWIDRKIGLTSSGFA